MIDSNSDSDDDDLLNFDPFAPSQQSQQSTASSEDDALLSPPSTATATDEKKIENHESRVEKAAKSIVESNHIASDKLRKPSELYWHKCASKAGVRFYPCRLCPQKEAFGLYFSNGDKLKEDTHVLVQYINYPDFEKYKIVTKKALLEYHNGGDPGRWNEKLCELYAKQERARHRQKRAGSNSRATPKKMGKARNESFELDRDVRVEILFLGQVLALAQQTERDDRLQEEEYRRERIEIQEEHRKKEQQHTNTSTSDGNDDDDGSLEEPYSQTINEDEEDRMYGYFNSATTKSNEPIRVGDWITYFSHVFAAGDKRGRRVAEVLEVNPRGNPVLRLDNGEFLPKDTQVKRIKVIKRKKLEDHPFGIFRPISGFKLRTMARKDPAGKTESERLGNIIQKNLQKFNDNLKKDGLESMSCFMNNFGKKSKKHKSVQEANSDCDFESPKKIHAKKSTEKDLDALSVGSSSSSSESVQKSHKATKSGKVTAKAVRKTKDVDEIDLLSPESTFTINEHRKNGDFQAARPGHRGLTNEAEMLTQASSSTNDSDFQRARRKFREEKRLNERDSYRNVDKDSDSDSSDSSKSTKPVKRPADEIKSYTTVKKSKKLPLKREKAKSKELVKPQLELTFTKTNAKRTTRTVDDAD
uniref:Uncharacterized protein n=1 Tax=Leptocylindrus danicus TaxID=163516 RepID=A0A7S2KP02_9STRA|mmetsp:Transcript_24108/g.36174  ORF Transcript_24108/g.36174 Transcript_24108/m.36174 type:complete len:643 (+) Transcript_24108:115-2043(+)|eukprot:CAMPEP_0116010372 /NCGR_PEP_ID=MMETSP0321-20121206/3963_1 /TAXON_ID=163516 /ORGANISM="Leptocylindrus danicus var. danicus, Strain B650" /LENGTH=642 /DNA_ID=CAMNT_0003479461 /DNA_START=78 /DNA_END=2006 /DNA_ORIENTATION=-